MASVASFKFCVKSSREPSPTHGYRAYMHGSSAIIETNSTHERIVRVRGVFENGDTTDWYAYTIRPE